MSDLDALERLPKADEVLAALRPWTSPAAHLCRERFDAKVYRCPMSGCWLWTGIIASPNYGAMIFNRKRKVKTHRLSWEMNVGPIPDGLQVLHRCDVPSCVNPAHLFLGTHTDNMLDRTLKGRRKRRNTDWCPACPQGHQYDAANTYTDKHGKRHCRTCARDRARGYWRRDHPIDAAIAKGGPT